MGGFQIDGFTYKKKAVYRDLCYNIVALSTCFNEI